LKALSGRYTGLPVDSLDPIAESIREILSAEKELFNL
jgi:hypothetical protein